MKLRMISNRYKEQLIAWAWKNIGYSVVYEKAVMIEKMKTIKLVCMIFSMFQNIRQQLLRAIPSFYPIY